ncbi:MAG: efflux RND transporter periplasmic adaptor subunit [Clostridia bacterium]|nr:efflux RND transporter periplasmic adaptor subunit [Clostridia bacterium]
MKRAKTFFSKENISGFFKPTKRNFIIWAVILAVLIGIIAISAKKKNSSSVAIRETDVVTYGDIQLTITGSAAVEPYERFEIIPKVSGDIVYCPFDVGDSVNEGDLLYGFDTSSSDLTVERQRLALEQSENNYQNALEERDKLYIKAKNNGTISGLSLKAGQDIKNGTKIADVSDADNLEVVLPFTSAQVSSIHVGDSATITSSKHMSSVTGTVTHVSSAGNSGSGGTSLYNVTVQFKNPGAFYAGMTVGGAVGANISSGGGTVENLASSAIYAETDGTVSNVYYANGDYVTKGTVIATLTSDSVADKITDSTISYKSAALSMRQTEKDLEDYNITSPISGTVITKKSKAGDTIDKSTVQTVMMVVADISKLKFELSIDELDISKVSEGQPVSITCDALPDETFSGYITTISVEGTAQNGVTTYSAEVVIDEPGNLRPSMNIDASVITASAENVLVIPTEDIKTVGKKSFVFVKDDKKTSSQSEKPQKNSKNMPKMPDMPSDKDMPEMPSGKDMPKNSGNTSKSGSIPSFMPEAPDGYRAVEIETGISNEDYTEVLSGLSEGQEIYRQNTVSTSNNSFMMGGGMSGGMGGGMGSRPSGSMGGPPSGMGGMR